MPVEVRPSKTPRSRSRRRSSRTTSWPHPHASTAVEAVSAATFRQETGPLPAKGYASQGESWSFALALRLASYDHLRSVGSDPVLILDDVFSELDGGRRERLAELVGSAEQVLVTAAVPDDVPEALSGARVDVMDGEVAVIR